MGLIELFTGDAGAQISTQIEQKFGVNKQQFTTLLATATPLIISSLQKKSENPDEAEALNNTLDRNHDGSILANPQQLFERQEEGNAIMNHIFGSDKTKVENQLFSSTGISMDKIGPILAALAPVIMGVIGKEKQAQGVGASGITDLLGGLLGGKENSLGSILGNVLGGNSGNPLRDVLGNVLGGNNKSEGLGGLLGGIFGKK